VPVVLRGLYVILDPNLAGGRDIVKIARDAVVGGARAIQWRDKTREKGLQLPDVQGIATVCRGARVPLIINDDVDLALAVGAAGVHVGQKDLPVLVVRRLGPFGWIVGASANNVDEARRAEVDGADYVSVGNLFGTSSKEDTRPATLAMLREVKAAVRVPVCAIGGINETNVDSVIAAGADMAAVISAVVAAKNPRTASQRLAGRFAA
jgi:thiamine-phosphate pyrophosphorylase